MTPDPLSWIDEISEQRRRLGLERGLIPLGPGRTGRAEHQGGDLIDFASNDYLGLSGDPRVIAAAIREAERHGWGAGASPLVSGWKDAHQELSDALAAFERTEAVVLFPTGYAANLGTISALVGPGDAVFIDRLDHSSLVQGARLSGAALRVYPHGDLDRLVTALDRGRDRHRRILIATDGVFSMDGDLAPLPELVGIAERFGAMLLVDEAHGTGVLGPDGRGAASALGVADRVPIRVGTLSKALGSIGGFVAGSRRLVDHLINHAPTLIYSTALPAPAAAAARRALRIVVEEPWRRDRIQELGRRLRDRLRDGGYAVPESTGPIVPVLLGDSASAVTLSLALRAERMIVPAIRPPTVPRGSARLRIGLSTSHLDSDLDALVDAMVRLKPR
ncbi:aminotransferase class I/II-fold pyridoxal phosphate-dependent enzyme [Tautonia plasticadhaerens]|uniref:8-amino-7-oxononanoate synthase n=1 Tax=Tautonia plasticadhaerens TaxID=2527974 RepID=A0A518H8D5_9BACT|nr:8-amino-7-oxononanoate synthase [Tautonia plasticadhaerens]QDV37119.1 8-amino-7-oxononanoate synthase [Tautonia plasticadhaerens]